MRLPVASNLKSRDGTTTKDAKVVNGIVEPDGDVIRVKSRPGNSDLGLVRAGTAQGAYYFNGQIITVHANLLDRSTVGPLANTAVGGLGASQCYFADNGLTAGITGFLLGSSGSTLKRLRSDWLFSVVAGPGVTAVPGVVFLDGYYFVMDATGTIWNSPLNTDPENGGVGWSGTSFITANKFSGAGVYLARCGSYIVALKEHSTEPFYDAGNQAPGSPLSPVSNAFTEVGCASAASVATVEGSIAWISQSKSKGRGVHLMTGAQQQRVSTPDIDRILDADDLATVHAFGCKLGGHVLYFLTLVTSNVTLVYDVTAQTWVQWSSLTAQTPASITSITRSGATATVTFAAAHGLSDGDPLLIAGATPSDYNGIKQVSYVSTTVVTFRVTGSPTTPATGTITGARYVESYFKFSHYVNAGGRDILLHESDGHLYEILPTLYQDAGSPIRVFNRLTKIDGGTMEQKEMAKVVVIADAVGDYAMVRFSNDDCRTFSKYKAVNLSLDRPRLRRCGPFRRRVMETNFVGNNPLRIEALELEMEK